MRALKSRATAWTGAVGGLVLLLMLAACGAATPSSGAAPNRTAVTTTFASVVFRHMPTGTAQLIWTPQDHSLTVKVTMQGLVPGTSHPAHIHKGSCQHAGPVVYPLPMLRADEHGQASITAVFRGETQGIPATGWYINVHNGPTAITAAQIQSISCGDISNPASSSPKSRQQVNVTLGEDVAPNQAIKGQAQLRLEGHTLAVHVTVSGLVPDSTHDFQLHAGSCSNMGQLLYNLQPLKANARGEADASLTVNGIKTIPSNGWYLVLYQTSGTSVEANSDIIACGDVLPAI
ncbi:CHRD domain-containing protein [Thermogemmatispora onikobensis]|uniref:CHRD domain-containing protein n=1 Tax=Thermogemmatispora onikobensis TaxID=732234 RepID=UPI0008528EAE|nr:CHRD domain-containing protein [Thermogemmatispora onikobensis]